MLHFTFVDFLIGVLILGNLYFINKCNLFDEFVHLCGVLVATFMSAHYYRIFAVFLTQSFSVPEHAQNILAFSLIAIFIVLVFIFIRYSWLNIFKIELDKVSSRTLGGCVLVLKTYLLCSLVVLALLVSGYNFVVLKTNEAMLSRPFRYASVSVYKNLYYVFVARIFHGEKLNEDVFGAVEIVEDEEAQGVL